MASKKINKTMREHLLRLMRDTNSCKLGKITTILNEQLEELGFDCSVDPNNYRYSSPDLSLSSPQGRDLDEWLAECEEKLRAQHAAYEAWTPAQEELETYDELCTQEMKQFESDMILDKYTPETAEAFLKEWETKTL